MSATWESLTWVETSEGVGAEVDIGGSTQNVVVVLLHTCRAVRLVHHKWEYTSELDQNLARVVLANRYLTLAREGRIKAPREI